MSKKKTQFVEEQNGKNKLIEEKQTKNALVFGGRKIKDCIAVDIDRSHEDYLKIGDKFTRSFIINGYPAAVNVGWLDDLFYSDLDIDTAIHLVPCDGKAAMDALTKKITQFQAQLDIEAKKGNTRNITMYQDKIAFLVEQRRGLEQNYENLFYVQIAINLYANDLATLNKQTEIVVNKLKGKHVDLEPMYLEQEEAYKTALPIGKSFIPDKFRNFNSRALSACFPFCNSELTHKNGTFIAINMFTGTPIFVDFYDRSVLNSSNMSVFGQTGSGKTFFVSLLTLRSVLRRIQTAIIDPEGEYNKIAEALGCPSFKISADAELGINPFDIEAEFVTDSEGHVILDANGKPKQIVDVKNKVADNLNLIGVMVKEMSSETQAIVSHVMQKMYAEAGITEDPKSLYDYGNFFDQATGTMSVKRKKPMPTISDFRNRMKTFIGESHAEVDLNKKELNSFINTLSMFCKSGIYDMFDRQTSPELQNFLTSPVINFDVSQLEENILRPIGMYVAMTWIWEKIVKRNPDIKKRVICDEAWMLTNKNMNGHEFTAQFLEKCARRIRKRNGGLLVASQRFTEFADCSEGQAVLANSAVDILLNQKSSDIDALQDIMKLSDGEKHFVLTSQRGEMLIRMNNESSIGYVFPFEYEEEFINKNKKKQEQ